MRVSTMALLKGSNQGLDMIISNLFFHSHDDFLITIPI